MTIERVTAQGIWQLSYEAREQAKLTSPQSEPETEQTGVPSAAFAGLWVTLSAMGQARAAEEESNRDIEQSDLPGQIKQLLLRMREIRQQIEQKQQALQELLRGADLTSTQVQARADALRAELNSLSSAVQQLNVTLLETMAQSGLTEEQEQQIAVLSLG